MIDIRRRHSELVSQLGQNLPAEAFLLFGNGRFERDGRFVGRRLRQPLTSRACRQGCQAGPRHFPAY